MDITKVKWRQRTSYDEMRFRVGGRLRINLQRKLRMLERREEVARFAIEVGFPFNIGCTDLWKLFLRHKQRENKNYYIGRTAIQDDVAAIFGKDWYTKYRKNRITSMQLYPTALMIMYGHASDKKLSSR